MKIATIPLKMSALFVLLGMFGAGCLSTSTVSAPTATTSTVSGAVLDLSGRGLTAIPADVFSQTDLVTLDLSQNALTGAPQAEIGHLIHLRSLRLSHNRLTGLPAEIGRLSALEELDVSNNQLTGLPLELGQLSHLRVLNVMGNPYSVADLDAIAKQLPRTTIKR